MLINTASGGRHEVRNIDHIRIKGHADGRWSLKIYPRAGDLLMPSGASMSEVEVLPEEVERIRTLAGHLIASIPPEFGGERRHVATSADEKRRIAEAERAEELFRLQEQEEQTPADPINRGLAALDRLAAEGQHWDQDGGKGADGLAPLGPGEDPARHGQVVKEGRKFFRL